MLACEVWTWRSLPCEDTCISYFAKLPHAAFMDAPDSMSFGLQFPHRIPFLPDTPLHNALLAPPMQSFAFPEHHLHLGSSSTDHSSFSGTERDDRSSENPQQHLKKSRKDNHGSSDTANAYLQRSFWAPSSLPNSTPPQLQQTAHQSFHYSPSGVPFDGAAIQKPIPSLPGVLPARKSLKIRPNFPVDAPNLQSSGTSAFYDPSQVAARRLAVQSWGNKPLPVIDPHVWDIMEKEKNRQWKGIELVASENFTSQAVIEALGSHLTNKYSEGMPGARFYGGNENIDFVETLCVERALKAFHLEPKLWGVNVQPYSCTSANFAVYTALLQPKDRIMGLDSPSGGHLSHGYYTSSGKKVSAASIFFETFPYRVDSTGYIDFGDLERVALVYKPKLLICGASAYPREWNYARFRDIADRCGAILMCDMSHISGLVAAQQCNSPFEYCDIVTSTTHKSLRGPRGGMIFYRRGQKRGVAPDDVDHYDFEAKINFAVLHSVQGGPHNNRTAALAVALLQVDTPEFKAYIGQVLKNAKALATALQKRDCKLVTGGTDNHLMLWDLRLHKLTGNQYEKVCEICGITLNKSAIYGDSGATTTGGVRIGTPAMTSRGCLEDDFEVIAEFLLKALQIAHKVRKEYGNAQKAFIKGLQDTKEIEELRASVEKFASSFEMPGFDISILKYNQYQ